MGIWDYVSSATQTISGGVARSVEIVGGAVGKARAAVPYLSGAWEETRDLTGVVSESAVWTTRAVAERMPDREGWEKIGRLGLRIADHAIDKGTKSYTCGMPVYKFVKEELRKDKSQKQPLKLDKEKMELATLIARIESFQKEKMELQELKLRMVDLEKKLVEIKQRNQKDIEKRAILMYWYPSQPVDLTYNEEFTMNLELSL